MKETLVIVAKGFCMGAADVVPGVSGGTMALILGIYRRLLEAIRAFDLRLLSYLKSARLEQAARHVDVWFLLPLGTGILAALMFFTRIVALPGLVVSHPELVYGFFFGLISGSIVVLLRTLTPLRLPDLGGFVAGTLLGFALVRVVPFDTPEQSWFIFLSGALAICAMILPGISGSFILLVLRKYVYVFDAIARFDLTILLPFALGAVCGLMLFSRALVWLLRRHYRATLTTIIGMLTGSLWVVWPFQERSYEVLRDTPRLVHSTPVLPAELNGTSLTALSLVVLGCVLVVVVEAMAGTKGSAEQGVA